MPEVEDVVMRKLMTWVYTGDLGKTSNLYQEEIKAAVSVLQLDLKVKDSVADTPKSLQKSSRGKKAPATSPALNLVEDYEKAKTEKKAKMSSRKRKSDIKFVQENGNPMSETDNSPKKRGKKRGAVLGGSTYIHIEKNEVYGNFKENKGDQYACNCKDDKLCGEDSCLNRMLMFECDPKLCTVPDQFRNMRFQKRQYPDIKCFRTLTTGLGLKSNVVIKKDAFVIEYVGELITKEEYGNRLAVNQLTGEENYYYLAIDAHRMIDAGRKGNLARFMNHSCDPNCFAQKWTVNGDIRVGLFAIKDIQPGSELTFNYQFETVGDNKKQCMCGAANCSGLIGEKPIKEEKRVKEDKNKKLNVKKNKK